MGMNYLKLAMLPGFLFLFIVGSGIWVRKIGKPYNNLLFNIHKLIALGTVILTGIRLSTLDPIQTFPRVAILLIALAALGVIGMFATGAFMSIKEVTPRAAQIIHKVFPLMICLSLFVAFYIIIVDQYKIL